MNNLQSAVGSMKAMQDSIKQHTEEVNQFLKKLGLDRIDTSTALDTIDSQIKSADCTYTIAMVGTFKAGKSTIINSLLELKGSDRLSSNDDQDTAMETLLQHTERMGSDLTDMLDKFKMFTEKERPQVAVVCSEKLLFSEMSQLFTDIEDIDVTVYGAYDDADILYDVMLTSQTTYYNSLCLSPLCSDDSSYAVVIF